MKLIDALYRHEKNLFQMSAHELVNLGLDRHEIAVIDYLSRNFEIYPRCPPMRVQNGRDAWNATGIVSEQEEKMIVLSLHNDDTLIAVQEIASGSRFAVEADEAKIVAIASIVRCSKIVLVHNHPMRGPISEADEYFTEKVQKALALVNVDLYEHYVRIGDEMQGILFKQKIKLK